MPALADRLPVAVRRIGYRGAYLLLRVYWFLVRPSVSGVKCVLTDRNQVLLVRHTYGPRAWDLPGGSIKRGESPPEAATREIHEELGVTIPDWRSLGRFELRIDHRNDSLHCFQAELHAPELVVDLGELETVSWFAWEELPRVGRYTRQILGAARAD